MLAVACDQGALLACLQFRELACSQLLHVDHYGKQNMCTCCTLPSYLVRQWFNTLRFCVMRTWMLLLIGGCPQVLAVCRSCVVWLGSPVARFCTANVKRWPCTCHGPTHLIFKRPATYVCPCHRCQHVSWLVRLAASCCAGPTIATMHAVITTTSTSPRLHTTCCYASSQPLSLAAVRAGQSSPNDSQSRRRVLGSGAALLAAQGASLVLPGVRSAEAAPVLVAPAAVQLLDPSVVERFAVAPDLSISRVRCIVLPHAPRSSALRHCVL